MRGASGRGQLAEVVEASTGVNLWAQWANIEICGEDVPYELPPCRSGYGGLIVSLAKQEWPDLSGYTDPEIAWRMKRLNHAGLIVRSENPQRVQDLLDNYVPRFFNDFHTSLPVPDRPTN